MQSSLSILEGLILRSSMDTKLWMPEWDFSSPTRDGTCAPRIGIM